MSKAKAKETPKINTNHIEEYFDATQGNKSSELFRLGESEDIDLKTDLSDDEIKIITTLYMTDLYLEQFNIPPVFAKYYNKYLRLRVSKDRLGRSEFVTMNSTENTDEILNKLGNATAITGSKK